MQFTDMIFLFGFLPMLLVVYYVVRPKFRNIVLILFSLFFYACGSLNFFGLLLFVLMVDVGIAKLIITFRTKQTIISKLLLIIGIIINLGILGYYKYSDFAISNINQLFSTDISSKNLLLPLGLSFFAFKAVSYLIDAYKGIIETVDNIQGLTYLSFFGQIQSGPIARYNDFNDVRHLIQTSCFYNGAVRFMTGFSKKVLIADVLSNITIEIFDQTEALSMPIGWLGAICYSLQLYYDFSGYSDMAIGICGMLGLYCPENFNYPYMTKSISEFWRRWHITLGAWFRDYLYIPMGGSRVGKVRLYLNLFVVWILTGIWHGAGWTFIVWGISYFILIAIEKSLNIPDRFQNKIIKLCYRLFSILFIIVQWVIFRSNNLEQGILYVKSMFGGSESIASSTSRTIFLLQDYAVFIVIALILAFPIVPKIEHLSKKKKLTSVIYDSISALLIISAFIIALSFIVSGQNSPFLYGNF